MLTDMDPVIEMSGVGWAPDGQPVLSDVSLAVAPGEARGIVGAPGSGRTAILRVLLGLVQPDVGRASILGLDCWSDSVALQRWVSSPPVLTMWPDLTVLETMGFLHRLTGDGQDDTCRTLMERFDIDPEATVGAMSEPERHITSLIASLCRPTRVFLLDDVLTGVSDEQAVELAAVLAEVRRNGATVLLTGGPRDRLGRCCDSITTIVAGHLTGARAAVA